MRVSAWHWVVVVERYKSGKRVSMGRACCVLIQCVFLLSLVLRPTGADSVLVTVQTKSQAEMDTLTAAVDADAQNGEGPTRTTLGVIEATASRVVDVASPYLQTVPRSVPTLAMLNQVHYDLEANTWTFTYESMRIDPNDPLNQFKRVLYLTKRTTDSDPLWAIGDSGNTCLLTTTTDAQCLEQLGTDYTVPQALVADNDYLVFDETNGVVSVVTDIENSLLQTVQITIPHARIREYVENVEPLAYTQEIAHPTEGLRKQYVFGIGMLFYGSGSKQIIFDQFHLIENSREQVAISRETTYAVAQHVSFWTQRVKHDPATRVVLVEYLLDVGHTLNSINASINGQQVLLDTDCTDMQARIDALDNSACLTQYPLCEPQTYVTTTDGQVQTWASYVLPLPDWASSPFRINTLLNTTTPDGRTILSTLNFETSHEPRDVCANAVAQEFSPSDHVSATVYRGQALVPTVIEGYFTVDNSSAIGMPDALMTLVLKPRDAAAVAYFTEFESEYINLDEVYMSHALDESLLPVEVSNSMIGAAGGRAELALDADLLAACPLETSPAYDPSPDSVNTCVTTKDWAMDGQQARSYTPHMYFVRRVTGSQADQDWLQGNIFADDTASAHTFLTATVELIAYEQGFAQAYWIWPIFQWPGASPIGLKDTTLVSFAWSVSASPPPASLRRLLGFGGEATAVQNAKRRQVVREKKRSTAKLLKPKVDYARIKRLQAVQRRKIGELKRYVPRLFS